MVEIAKIGGGVVTSEDFVKSLKLNGKFDCLLDEMLKTKLTIHAAKQHGVSLSDTEVQERADRFRSENGLYRAKDAAKYLATKKITLDEFEEHIRDSLYQEKVLANVCSDEAVSDYFAQHSPKFDSIEISHMVVESEGRAKEVVAVLEEDVTQFFDLARELSIAATSAEGGYIGKVLRGSLPPALECKLFNVPEGSVLGPLRSAEGSRFEIYKVDAKQPAELNEETGAQVRRLLHEQWLSARARECRVQAL